MTTVSPNDIRPTTQMPTTGRNILVFGDDWDGPTAGLVIAAGTRSFVGHPTVTVVALGDDDRVPFAMSVLREVPLFDPLGGRQPVGCARWAEWMPYQRDQHAAAELAARGNDGPGAD